MESLLMRASNDNNATRSINILEAFDQWIGAKEVSLYKSASHGIFAKHLLDLHEVYCNHCAISVQMTLESDSDHDKNDPKRKLDFIKEEHIKETDYRNVDNTECYNIKVPIPSSAILLPNLSNPDGKSIHSNYHLEQDSGKVDMKKVLNQSSLISAEDSEEHPLLRSILNMPRTYRETNCFPLTTYNSFRGGTTSELRNTVEEIGEENNNDRSTESQDSSIFALEKCETEEKSTHECNEKHRNDTNRKERTLLSYAIKSPYLYQALTSNLPNTSQISQPYSVEQRKERNLESLRLQLPKWPVESKLLTDSGSIKPDFELYFQQETSNKKILNLHPGVYICGQCGKTTNHKGNLLLHIKRNHLPKSNICSFQGCTGKFAIFKDLQLHEKTVHMNMKPEKKIPCSHQVCPRTFRVKKKS